MRFKNPHNGYIVETNHCGLWTFIFGCFYFAKHGAWSYALMAFILAILTAGISWLIFPFFGQKIIKDTYLRKDWLLINDIDIKHAAPLLRPNATWWEKYKHLRNWQ